MNRRALQATVQKVKYKLLGHVQPFSTAWTVACQASLSMKFSRQKYWSGKSFPSHGDLPRPGIKFGSPGLWADSSLSEPYGEL